GCYALGPTDTRTAALPALLVAVAAAAWWRIRVPIGNRGPWGWVGATLLLLPAVAVLRVLELPWAALVVEDVAVAIAAIGLYALTARGYLRQARSWGRLEADVRRLRASSALLPGLSVTPEDEQGLPERHDVEGLLRRGAPQVALQPVVELATGSTVGQEALCRFGDRVPVDRWFRAAGMHGLGPELERLALAAVLRALEGLPQGQFLAVNTSPASLHDEHVLALLRGADLSRVVVEVTEHDAVTDYPATRRALAGLREAGARIAVDDVGAGFASLQHVLLLQPDLIKLDSSLTRDVHHNPRRHDLVSALVGFASEVGATVLAEGIEVPGQVDALIEAGVRLGQGWHLGLPVVVEQ
ncbi:MAG: EAL domain-containing protein, partial [Mycobacteriales bacterium]